MSTKVEGSRCQFQDHLYLHLLLIARQSRLHGTPFTVCILDPCKANGRRLHATELPDGESLRTLVEEYFAHIHPLRCNGFVHKPSFMRRLDEDVDSCRQSESLLHIICALGAKYVNFSFLEDTTKLHPDSSL